MFIGGVRLSDLCYLSSRTKQEMTKTSFIIENNRELDQRRQQGCGNQGNVTAKLEKLAGKCFFPKEEVIQQVTKETFIKSGKTIFLLNF